MTPDARAEGFVRDLAELKIPDPAAARAALWLRLGALLMVAGLAAGALAFPLAHATDSALGQGDALALGLGGACAAVVGAALFLRHSLTGFLRFWLARQSYELERLGDRLTTPPEATVPAPPDATVPAPPDPTVPARPDATAPPQPGPTARPLADHATSPLPAATAPASPDPTPPPSPTPLPLPDASPEGEPNHAAPR